MSYVLDLSCQGTKCIFTFTDVINFHVLKIVIFVGVNLSIHVRLFSLEPSFVVCTFFSLLCRDTTVLVTIPGKFVC